MKNFEYIYPKDVASIPKVLPEQEGKATIQAGGTDLLARMKEGITDPQQLLNLKALKDLNYIREESDGVHIGATTLLVDLAESKEAQAFPGLVEAALSISTIQLRNMGTVGGNLCQRPRCWYYRSRHFPCARKGGDICYAVGGENKYHCILGGGPCFIVHPSDLAPMLVALDAKVTIMGPDQSRTIPVQELYVLPETDVLHETILKPNELVTEVIVPKQDTASHYVKFKERKSFDFAMVSVAIAAQTNGQTLKNVRIAMGGVAPIPWRARKAEKALEGKAATPENVTKAAEEELQDAVAMDQNEYKFILSKNLMKRTVREMLSS
ncbi:xanthine dehydrogenase family protein subunit M [candidate division KSB1 bacterium]|nr:xanthine dehydrogenase family protein subunit M [candidate division KSB1 bacterium]